jgi:GrpB-like predicted nucleotidyltransferase (UPF0157 family)
VSLGLARGTVRLVQHDPRWASAYLREAAILRRALGSDAGEIEHIGSTAVAGMDAKPIIDLMVAMPLLRAPASLYDALRTLGYEHRPDDEDVSDRLFFAKGSRDNRTHHLSACTADSTFWRIHLYFRDKLRTDAALAEEYRVLKRGLAARHASDRAAYTEGKARFVARVVAGATGAGRSPDPFAQRHACRS